MIRNSIQWRLALIPTLNEDQKLIILLLGADNNKPIPSIEHLKAELFLVKRALSICGN